MKQRQIDLLGLIIKEYIKSGVPIASEALVEEYGLEYSPATVRNEMMLLEEEGYLYQPHTSAGRVPSDKGYRFYVDYLMKLQELSKKEEQRLQQEISEWQENTDRLIHNLARAVAEFSRAWVVSGTLNNKDFYEQAGVPNLLEQTSFEDAEDVQQVLVDLEYLDKNTWELTQLLHDDIKIYIGRENPLRSIQNYSTIISAYELPNHEKGFLALIGSKRMNYEKNISLVEYVINNLN